MRLCPLLLLLGCATSAGTQDPQAPAPDPAAVAQESPAAAQSDGAPAPRAGGSGPEAWVAAHNAYRAQHCAGPVAWSDEISKVAQAWADRLRAGGCNLEHSSGKYGENLAGGSGGLLDAGSATKMWFDEVAKYDFGQGGFSMETGHFTQVVWKGTTKIGCAKASCGGSEVFVCNYDPPGNVEGGYRDNVAAKGCR